MEEQKKTKNQSMDAAGKEGPAKKKFTYEEVVDIANRVIGENQTLKRQLNEAVQTIGMYNRLDYLFRVLQYESVIKDAEFINSCVAEIKEFMTLPATEEKENPEKEG